MNKNELSPEEFVNTAYIQQILAKYRKTAVLLRPHLSGEPIGFDRSKFGGIPNLNGFSSYPACDCCSTPLNFVVQLYKEDFPAHYFPPGKDLFQLFRCPNDDCDASYEEQSDHKMFAFYFELSDEVNAQIEKPLAVGPDIEKEVPDCELRPSLVDDFPKYDDFGGDDFGEIEEIYGEELSEYFMENFTASHSTKIGGYPSYTQSPVYPECTCGKTKEFFFQLSSDDREDGIQYPPELGQWSAHRIMIGDVGNIYFYVCKDCGEKSIESYWDCY